MKTNYNNMDEPTKYWEATTVQVSVHRREDNPVFGDSGTRIEIMDECAGPFIKLSQCSDRTRDDLATMP